MSVHKAFTLVNFRLPGDTFGLLPGFAVMNSIEDRIARAYQNNQQAAIQLIFAELSLGLTLCKLTEKDAKNDEKYCDGLKRARMALQAAEKFMWIVKMKHPEFDQMMAQVERLKFELETQESNGAGHHWQ